MGVSVSGNGVCRGGSPGSESALSACSKAARITAKSWLTVFFHLDVKFESQHEQASLTDQMDVLTVPRRRLASAGFC